MQHNPQRELFELFPLATDTYIQRVNVDQWCTAANDDSAQCFLKTALQSMVSGSARELHIEQEADLCRVRLRVNGKLTEQKVYRPAFATEIMQIISKQGSLTSNTHANDDFGQLNVPVQIDGEKANLSVWHYKAVGGKCLTLSLNAASKIPEILEQTRLDASAKQAIRHHYKSTANSGITLIVSQSDDLLRSVHHALLGEVNSVECKIVSLQHRLDKKIPRVSQILTDADVDGPVSKASEQRTLVSATTQSADHIFVDWKISSNNDVITALKHQTGITLFWRGNISVGLQELVSGNSLCSSLHTIIELTDVGMICPHCAEDYKLKKSDYKKLRVASKETNESFFFANGCSRCDDTGVSSLATVTSVCEVSDTIRDAVERRSLQDSRRAIATVQGKTSIAAQMETLARTGKISFENWIEQRDSGAE